MIDSPPVPSGPPVPTGRRAQDPRDRENAIIDAAMALVAEIGYDRLTMDAVAGRARASKATIYRRWNGKAELVAAGLRRDLTVSDADIPNTGSLRGDLLEVLRTVRARVTGQYRGLLVGLMRAMQDDPQVAGLFRAQLAANQQDLRRVLERNGAERGEVLTDVALAQEIAPAQVMTRVLITGEPVDDEFLEHLVDRVLLPLVKASTVE